MQKTKLILIREVFGLLLKDLLATVDLPEDAPVRQLFGFGEGRYFNPDDPNLASQINNHAEVAKRLASLSKSSKRSTIEGKYLYLKNQEYQRNNKSIQFTGAYAWAYLTYLGFESIRKYLIKKLESSELSADKYKEQLDVLDGKKLTEIGYYTLSHFSTLWQGIYLMQLAIDFNSQTHKGGSTTYNVTATSGMEHTQPIKYTGKARHERNYLHVDIFSREGRTGEKHFIFAVGHYLVEEMSFFEGSYIGISRNSDIISGRVFMTRNKDNIKIDTKVPRPIKQNLYLDKPQLRTQLNPKSINKNQLSFLVAHKDPEGFLKHWIGTYRLCWFSPTGNFLESQLTIDDNFQCYIQSFNQAHRYDGNISVNKENLYIQDITLRENYVGTHLNVTIAFLVKEILDKRSSNDKVIIGSFLFAGSVISPIPFTGFCALERVHKNEKVNVRRIPKDHIKSEIGNALACYDKLLEHRKKLVLDINQQDSIT